MKLLYYLGRTPNFGDDLNASLWPELAPELFEGDDGAAFVGIGTIIGMPCDPNLKLNVFSSGVGNDSVQGWRERQTRYWCVRGPVSRKLLEVDESAAITDGAILAPLTRGFPKRADEPGGVVAIPHWQSFDFGGWDAVGDLTGYEILDPRAPYPEVIARIAAARIVLTESLHGAIFADLLGIPWHVFATGRNFGVTKWIDWSASVGRRFAMTVVPAPDPALVVANGRRFERSGARRVFELDDALPELSARINPVGRANGSWRAGLKSAVARSRLAGKLMGYCPEATAVALERLARDEPALTPPAAIESLQSRMVDRLGRLRAEHWASG